MIKEIYINSKKELDIYMNPQRQRLLKYMDIQGTPMTPKQLSELLEISASSATYHIKKLESLGIVELDHAELIHGICAKFYRRVPVQVILQGAKKDDLRAEKEAFLDYMMNDVWNGFKHYMKTVDVEAEEKGDVRNGILYLDDEAVRELMDFMHTFEEKYSSPKAHVKAWEVALIAYPRKNGE